MDSQHRPDPQLRAPAIRDSTPVRSQHRDKNTDFIMTGFHQTDGIRYYVYQAQRPDGSLSESTVDADVKLLRKHGIALQELPLLCRRLLEKQDTHDALRSVTFTEDLMKEQADHRAALKQAAQDKKKTYRRPHWTRRG